MVVGVGTGGGRLYRSDCLILSPDSCNLFEKYSVAILGVSLAESGNSRACYVGLKWLLVSELVGEGCTDQTILFLAWILVLFLWVRQGQARPGATREGRGNSERPGKAPRAFSTRKTQEAPKLDRRRLKPSGTFQGPSGRPDLLKGSTRLLEGPWAFQKVEGFLGGPEVVFSEPWLGKPRFLHILSKGLTTN